MDLKNQENKTKFLKKTIEIAKNAFDNGNHPFGAILVDEDNQEILMIAENEVNTLKDVTKHVTFYLY
jgi:tRNA(Arg) A34 adenosine deaminase TadA